jgi:hypothetical protein
MLLPEYNDGQDMDGDEPSRDRKHCPALEPMHCNLPALQSASNAICQHCNLPALQSASTAICQHCNLPAMQSASTAICQQCNLPAMQSASIFSNSHILAGMTRRQLSVS